MRNFDALVEERRQRHKRDRASKPPETPRDLGKGGTGKPPLGNRWFILYSLDLFN